MRRRRQQLPGVGDYTHNRPDRCDTDVRYRIGQQASTVGAGPDADTSRQLGQRAQRPGPHSGNVIMQGRSQRLKGSSVGEGANRTDRGESSCRSLVVERLESNL